MKAKLLLISTFFIFLQLYSQTAPVYFNSKWEVTTKENATFYRPMPLKEVRELILVKDFFSNGTLQFEGYALKSNEDHYVGDIVWYDENGNNDNMTQYKNYSSVPELTYYYENGKPRKIISYKNGVKSEVKIYDPAGKILMSGYYKEGKPERGDFETLKRDYSTNRTYRDQEDGEEIRPIPPMVVSTAIPQQRKLPNKESRQTVSEKIFWDGTYKIAEEKKYVVTIYGYDQIEQKNYDAKGALIQNLTEKDFGEYNYRILDGKQYEYYVHNNFAKSLKSEMPFIKGIKSGKNRVYFPNGSVLSETNFERGTKDGQENIFDSTGKLLHKRIYKKGEEYDGNFDETIGDYFINLNYINGTKEGNSTAKDEDKKIIAEGIYKDDKPFNGTFITEKTYGDKSELINVKNFKKNGLQTVFNYRLSDIERTYTMQDDQLHGPTTYYINEKPVSVLEYKNDIPFEGTRTSGSTKMIYEKGQLVSETLYNNDSHKYIQTQKIYKNGIIYQITDATFEIPAVNEVAYVGIFKNGEPFSGYFPTDDSEYKQINYLENGQLKFQYSNDRMSNMDDYMHQTYDIKSTYKDGKIFDGPEYLSGSRQLVIRYYKNGVLKSFDWDLYAMNYFNRIHFELKNNVIEMTDYQEEKKASISLNYSKNAFSTKLYTEKDILDERIITADKNFKGKYSENILLYTIEKEQIISKNIYVLTQEKEGYGSSRFFSLAYSYLDDTLKTPQETFVKLSATIAGKDTEDEDMAEENSNSEMLTGVRLDKNGKPQDGIVITKLPNDLYKIELFSESKLINTAQSSISNIKTAIEKMENLTGK